MGRIGYDPLDYENIAKSIVQALLDTELHSVPPGARVQGPGVYAIYFGGDFPAYRSVTEPLWTKPIYVGCALPPGGRKGLLGRGYTGKDHSLYQRLISHARSIEAAANLHIEDFRCRYLVLPPVWVRLAERFLIEKFRPIWNLYVEGFGIHDPGKSRYSGALPPWDIVHPGRKWQRKMTAEQTPEQVLSGLRDALARGE